MLGEIERLIKEKALKAADVDYHTIRELEKVKFPGRIRALVLKGDSTAHIEYTCPNCGYSGYKRQGWKEVSKAAKFRFTTECDRCGFEMKVPRLKGGPKER